MADITLTGNKKLKTLNTEFQESFPYLMLAFFTKEEWEKAKDPGSEIVSLDVNLRVADLRTTRPEDGDELSINGNTIVRNLETNFFKVFGLYVQVCCRDAEGNGYFSVGEEDAMSLAEYNRYVAKRGAQEYPDPQPGPDESSVKGDRVTELCRAVHKGLCAKISALEPVNENAHHAKGKSINLYREYYATIDDAYIESFYIEFDPEEEEFYLGFSVTAPESDKRAFKKSLEEACSQQDIDTDEYGCFSTYEDFSYESFLEIDTTTTVDAAFELYNTVRKIRKELA